MSDYYEFIGALTFASAKDAKEAVASLRAVHDGETTFFWTPPRAPGRPPATDLVVEGATVRFAWKGFAGGAESYYTTRSVLEDVVKKALSGRVAVREEGGPVEYFGYKPRKKPAKKTAKRARAKRRRSP